MNDVCICVMYFCLYVNSKCVSTYIYAHIQYQHEYFH